ncbi:hypothetical protein DICVIV_06612 [Dictyocaulus viviparus]|uniref:Uncharacterized protein n=1 Tax=Dictyocaulus viviparus TaxID=29172 RepID=A0A0D8XY80_DICVI|nr:hypothetical protein DICVIV_06612 [Dictyocaulus viviparus]
MGFYGEDDMFCNTSNFYEQQPDYSSCNAKYVCLDQPIKSEKEKRPNFVVKKENFYEEEEDYDDDREKCSIRLGKLRRIGLKSMPCLALRKHLKKVANGTEPNPWLSNVYSERSLRKFLRRFMLGMVIRACENEGVEDCELEPLHREAFKLILNLNDELIQSLSAFGNFSTELLRCAKNNCQKAFISRDVANILLSRIAGEYTQCQVPECPRTVESHDDVNYLIVEGGSYSDKLEMPDYEQAPSKLLCLCLFHNGIFELMFDIIHMEWNVYHNCLYHVREILKTKFFKNSDDVVDELPSDLIRSLVHFYMARYFCLWAFGDVELWKKNGCTFFQALFGSE